MTPQAIRRIRHSPWPRSTGSGAHAIGPWQDHPWLCYARTRATPGTELDIRVRTQADRKALELARCYGFASFLVVPTPAAAQLGRAGVLCLGSAREGYFQQDATRFARLLVGADPNLSHRADRILSQGWKPTLRGSAVDKFSFWPASWTSLVPC